MGKHLTIFLLGAAFMACIPLSSFAGQGGDPVTLTFQEKQGHFDIIGHFSVQADSKVVWDTLTDFENYPHFSHELKKVNVTNPSPNHLTAEEMAESGVLFFTQKVYFTLDIHLEPEKSILSKDTGHKSFVSYQSEWNLEPGNGRKTMELTYHLLAEGHFGGPAFMVNDTFKGGIKNFLESMRKEILRRQENKFQK